MNWPFRFGRERLCAFSRKILNIRNEFLSSGLCQSLYCVRIKSNKVWEIVSATRTPKRIDSVKGFDEFSTLICLLIVSFHDADVPPADTNDYTYHV